MPLNRKSTRLSPPNYLGQKIYFITVCCDHRHGYLADPATAKQVLAILHEVTTKLTFLLHAYCAMPDHLHFLVHGLNPHCKLLRLMKEFKSRTAYLFKQEHGQQLWEMSYYDHIVRKTNALEPVACYFWNNPVRKGLCKRPEEFPFSGSCTIDWIKSARAENSFVPP
jgi:putative transposase